MNADKLLISAASAISKAGSRTSMADDSNSPTVPYLFPIGNRRNPIGHDFGIFRLEGELGYKHAKLKRANLDPSALAAVLNGDRHLSGAPATSAAAAGATRRARLNTSNLRQGEHLSVLALPRPLS
jgi:hypothetical protein